MRRDRGYITKLLRGQWDCPTRNSPRFYELFMNVLFELYSKSTPIRVQQLGAFCGENRHKVPVAVTVVIAVLCLAAIAFNVRFAVAMRHERRQSAETQSRKRVSSTTNSHLTERREKALDLKGSLAWLDNDSHTQSH